jgi:hypothetical protein
MRRRSVLAEHTNQAIAERLLMQLGRYSAISKHTGKDVHPWIETSDTDTVLVLGRNDDFISRIVLDAHEVLFIDTRGISKHLLDYIKPRNERNTIYFHPADRDFPIAFNPLSNGSEDTALHIVDIIRVLSGYKQGEAPQLEMVLRHAVRLALETPQPSFLSAYFILTSETYRKRLNIDDAYITEFWRDFALWDDRQKIERTQSTLNKLDSFLFHTVPRNILSQQNKVTFKDKVVLADLSGIPKDIACLLGSLLLQQSSSRVVVTDADWFKSPERDKALLEHRYLPDTPFDTLLVFKAMGKDTEAVAKELHLLPSDIVTIAPNCAYVKTPTEPTTMVFSQPHQRKFYGAGEKIIEQTRRKYCTPKKVVQDSNALLIKSVAGSRVASMSGFKRKRKS